MPTSRIAGAAGALVAAAAVTLAVVAPAAAPAADDAGPSGSLVALTDTADAGYVAPVPGDLVRPFDPPAQPWASGHRGADLAAAPGEVVVAANDGVVAFVGVVVDRPVVSIDHPDGIRTTYEPVEASVAVGDVVEVGDAIGTLSSAAGHCAPAGCLHWGARVGEVYLDPMSLLGDRQVRLYPLGRAHDVGAGGPVRLGGAPV